MQIPRFFIEPSSFDRANKTVAVTDAAVVKQLVNVLRFTGGEQIILLDGEGEAFRCTISRLERGGRGAEPRCEARIETVERVTAEPAVKLTLALPLLKSDRFDWAIEKLTELGVSSIVPLATRRSVVLPGGGIEQKLKRWQTIMREAAEQCERGVVPDIVSPLAFTEFIERLPAGDTTFICAERINAQPLSSALHAANQTASLVVLVGPEGGWTEEELKLAETAGAKPVTLGARILRSETAAIHAASLIAGATDNQSLSK